MNTRCIYILLSVVLSGFCAQGQNIQLQSADRYFENTYYSKAIPIYEEIIKTDLNPDVLLKLSDAYYFTFEPAKAARWYGLLHKNHPEKLSQQQVFQYIQTLKAIKNYREADAVYQKRFAANETEKEAFEDQQRYLKNVRALGNRFEIKNLPINTAGSEFGGVFHEGQFVFTASNESTGLFSKVFYWDNSPYLNLYAFPSEEIKVATTKQLFSEPLTSRFHESNAVFTKDGNTVYFTRNNYIDGSKTRDENKVTQLQIFKAEMIGGQWSNISSLPINNAAYSNEHPALSPDEKTLYFASNRPGGYGNFDIYKVDTQTFKKVENLGPEINTDQKEQFPFMDAEGNLYFSSDGHPGFGHLDVFISKAGENGNFEKPDNLGLPVNSGFDDFAYYLESDTKTGFFSSNRPGGKGSDDIYSFTETAPLIIEDCHQLISGVVRDKNTGELLPGSRVILTGSNGEIEDIFTGEDTAFDFRVGCNEDFMITASQEKYKNENTKVKTTDVTKFEQSFVLELVSHESIALEKEKIIDTEIKKMQQKLEADKLARVAQEEQKIREKQQRIDKILDTEELIVKDKDRYLIKTEPIYFDYDLWYIRQESRQVLAKVIDLLNKYPSMKLEIGTHTDIRGSVRYNEDLSYKRSASVVKYLAAQGIDTNRIIAKGYGKSTPVVYCESGESCTEEQHEINRRSEFVITGFE